MEKARKKSVVQKKRKKKKKLYRSEKQISPLLLLAQLAGFGETVINTDLIVCIRTYAR